jgi:hypothetical protein
MQRKGRSVLYKRKLDPVRVTNGGKANVNVKNDKKKKKKKKKKIRITTKKKK